MYIKQFLNEQDIRIFKRIRKLKNHPLHNLFPKTRNTRHNNLGTKPIPKINTSRYKNCFKNQLVFRYELVLKVFICEL